jgi:exosortase E/protease (VPEID-CTERM system)
MMETRTAEGSETLPYWRWFFLLALIGAEFLALSMRYDARGGDPERLMSGLIRFAGVAARLSIVVGLVTLMIVGPSCHALLKQKASGLTRLPQLITAIAGNLLAFASFYGLSAYVLEGPASRYYEGPLVVAWAITGLATLVFWAVAAVPVDLWASLSTQMGWGLAVGPLLGTSAFLCGLLARDQWKLLARATLQFVVFLLSLVFRDTICDPARGIVGTPSFAVGIAPECSGYEGMGLIGAVLAIYLWLFRRDLRFPRALVLLPAGMALMWLANALRIAALISLGVLGYPALAQGGFHSLAGWAFFLMIGLGLISFTRKSPFFSTIRESRTDTHFDPATLDGAYLVPAMAIIAVSMVTTSFSPGFDLYYPVRVIAAVIALFLYRQSYSELRLRWSWEAFAIGCGVFAFWIALEPLAASRSGAAGAPLELESLGRPWATAWLLFRVIGSVITVPIAEELAFRGYLTRRLIAADFQSIPPGRMTWLSFVLSSFVFGALHGRWFAGTLAGMAYALAYRRRGELTDAVLAHAVTNGLIAITVLSTGSWSLWS